MISNDEFYNNFVIFSTENKKYIRYIFTNIHCYFDDNHELNYDNNKVHVEHIMPQNIDSTDWDLDPDTHEKYLWRLGNLALLAEKLNKKASNRTFEEKKQQYAQSLIKPNQDLVKYSKWTPREIEERQKNLADVALKIWC